MQRFRRGGGRGAAVSDAYTAAAVVGAERQPRGSPPRSCRGRRWPTSSPVTAAARGRGGGLPAAWPRRSSDPRQGLVHRDFKQAAFSSPPTGLASSTSASPGRRLATVVDRDRHDDRYARLHVAEQAGDAVGPSSGHLSTRQRGRSPRPASRRSAAAAAFAVATGSCTGSRTSPVPRRSLIDACLMTAPPPDRTWLSSMEPSATVRGYLQVTRKFSPDQVAAVEFATFAPTLRHDRPATHAPTARSRVTRLRRRCPA